MEILARNGKLAAVLFAAALWGCAAPTQKMTDQDRARVKAVSIGNKVQTTPQMFLLAPGSGIGLMFGAIGGAASAGAYGAPATGWDRPSRIQSKRPPGRPCTTIRS